MKYLLVFAILILISWQTASAQTIQVSTGKTTYNYGDHLGVTISVSQITGNNAVMYIIDANEKKSTAIPVQIRNLTTTITSPNPFDSLIFKEGMYEIQVQYGDATASVQFEIVDAGNIVMPFGSNVVVPRWSDGSISDYGFLKFLVDNGALNLPHGTTLKETARIPAWYKANAQWWSERKITDEEFENGLDYLLRHKVIAL